MIFLNLQPKAKKKEKKKDPFHSSKGPFYIRLVVSINFTLQQTPYKGTIYTDNLTYQNNTIQ